MSGTDCFTSAQLRDRRKTAMSKGTIPFAVAAAFAVASLTVCRAFAAETTYTIFADGESEVTAAGVPNQGDLDGSAIGTITLNNGTGAGSTGSATINLTVALIDGTFSGHHIHQAPATTTGSIVVDFGNPSTILTGTPTAGTLSGTITGLPAATITTIFGNPAGFYYNLHSTPNFPGGAVRDQLTVVPEPGTTALFIAGACGMVIRRLRRR